ncbi:MAG: beta strand repeat-containing protein [Candidatus Acidiferrales bacterium]
MRTDSRVAALAAVAFAAALAVTGCGGGNAGGGGGSSTPPASGVVTVYPGVASVPADASATVQFSAFLASQPSATFTWTVTGAAAGTINASTGLYTPPTAVPSPATVKITATDTATTSEQGTATVTIVALQGVTVSPAALAVAAGTSATFTATVSGSAVTPTWQVNGIAGGNATVGTITAGGVYTAPSTPPSGGSVTITAVNGASTGTATAAVVFSNNSLSGAYAFSYSGSDASLSNPSGSGGPPVLAVAGSFNASAGSISGIEDYNSGGSFTVAMALPVSGSYQVYPDGSGSAVLTNPAALSGKETWQFTLAAGTAGAPSQHALLVRFDGTATGSGTIDRQNTAELSSLTSVSGNYVFELSGSDVNGYPIQFAGIFNTDGAGNIPANYGEEDINHAGNATQPSTPDLSLHGSYSLDTSNLGSGRGYITLINTSSQAACNCEFAFYTVDSTHLKVVEIDSSAILSGDLYAAPNTARGSYTSAGFSGDFAFTVGGADLNSGLPYAQGGVVIANGSGEVTGGAVDTNDGGSRHLNESVTSTSYTVDASLGRIALPITYGGTTANFAAYAASNGTIEMISLDPNYMDSGLGFLQTSTTTPEGAFALNLNGVLNSNGYPEQDIAGQTTVPASGAPTGNLDINDFENSGRVTTGVPFGSASSLGSAGTNGRGTASATTNLGTYPLIYYTVDGNTVLLFESDSSRTVVGALSRQF